MAKRLQRFANDVVGRGLHLLDTRDVVAAHDDGEVGEAAAMDFAAVVSEQRDSEQATLAGLFERHDDIPRAAAGGDADGDVLGPRLRDELTEKDHLSTDVI